MACGSCGKKRQSKYVVTTQSSQPIKAVPRAAKPQPQTIMNKVVNYAISNTSPKSKVKTSVTMTTQRCPVCKTMLKRVSRLGHGDLLQCPNLQCGYLRKVQ